MDDRPTIKVSYELTAVGDNGEVYESFSITYDYEMYYDDRESIDLMNIDLRIKEMSEIHGEELLLLEYSIERENHTIQ